MKAHRPIIVAYDISDNRMRTRIHKILKDWRLGGQKSVHECRMKSRQAEELFLQLAESLDQETDRLLMAWLEPHRSVLHRGLGKSEIRKKIRHVR